MQNATLWRALLGVEKAIVEDVEYDEDEQLLVAHVRPRARDRARCGRCDRSSPVYDRGEGRRRWRALDLELVGDAVFEVGGHRADADRLADRGSDHHPGLGKRGHRYLTVVVDHDSGRLVWAAPGRDKATLDRFFDALGEQRCVQITHVSAEGADWISSVVTQRCPNAVLTRSMWCGGPPTRWTRSAARPGTKPAVRSPSVVPVDQQGRRRR